VRIDGAVALITGASTGIGAATAVELAQRGAHVLLVARNAETLDERVADIRGRGGRAESFPADVGDQEQVAALGAEVRERVGVPDIVVNNAGAGRWLYLDETEPSELETMTAVPYTAALFVTREFLQGMLARRRGWIVNLNSPVSRMTWAGATGYAGARWALRGLTAALRQDLRGSGVGVSEVVPGKVLSDYFANNPGAEERIPKVDALMPAQTPEQVASAVALAVERERREVLLPWPLKVFDLAGRFTPRLVETVVAITGHRRRLASSAPDG
jgi:short-subunit dehydrogenase